MTYCSLSNSIYKPRQCLNFWVIFLLSGLFKNSYSMYRFSKPRQQKQRCGSATRCLWCIANRWAFHTWFLKQIRTATFLNSLYRLQQLYSFCVSCILKLYGLQEMTKQLICFHYGQKLQTQQYQIYQCNQNEIAFTKFHENGEF